MANQPLDFPETDQQSVNQIHVQQLRRDAARGAIGHVLRQWSEILYPDQTPEGRQLTYARITRVADLAVASIEPSNEHDAMRLAELAFESTVRDAERDARILSSDRPDAQLFINAALTRMSRLLLNTKPMNYLVSIYQTALEQKGAGR